MPRRARAGLILSVVLGACPRPVALTAGTEPPARADNGAPCAGEEGCVSGFCREGVCCDGACASPAASCVFPGQVGHCRARERGEPCTLDGQCPDGACAYGVCCNVPCGPGKACELPATLGTCVTRQLGDRCANPADCASGYCEQGVCCASACAGDCRSCDLPGGVPGLCTVATDGTDPLGHCAAQECQACFSGVCFRARAGTDPNASCPGALVCSDKPAGCGLPGGAPCQEDDECAVGLCVDGCMDFSRATLLSETRVLAVNIRREVRAVAALPGVGPAVLVKESTRNDTVTPAQYQVSLRLGHTAVEGWRFTTLGVLDSSNVGLRTELAALGTAGPAFAGAYLWIRSTSCGMDWPPTPPTGLWHFWVLPGQGLTALTSLSVPAWACPLLINARWMALGASPSRTTTVAVASGVGDDVSVLVGTRRGEGEMGWETLADADSVGMLEGAVLVVGETPVVLDVQAGNLGLRARWRTSLGEWDQVVLPLPGTCRTPWGVMGVRAHHQASTPGARVVFNCADSWEGPSSPVLATLAWDGDKPRWEGPATHLPAGLSLQPNPWLHGSVPVLLPNDGPGIIQANTDRVRLAWPRASGDWTWMDLVEVEGRMDGLFTATFTTAGNQTWGFVTAGELSSTGEVPIRGLRLDVLSLHP